MSHNPTTSTPVPPTTEALFETTPMRKFASITTTVRTSDLHPDSAGKCVAFPAEFLLSRENPPTYRRHLPVAPPNTINGGYTGRNTYTAHSMAKEVLESRDDSGDMVDAPRRSTWHADGGSSPSNEAIYTAKHNLTPTPPTSYIHIQRAASTSSTSTKGHHQAAATRTSSSTTAATTRVVYARVNSKYKASTPSDDPTRSTSTTTLATTTPYGAPRVGARVDAVLAKFPIHITSQLNKIVLEESHSRSLLGREARRALHGLCEEATQHWNTQVAPNLLFIESTTSNSTSPGVSSRGLQRLTVPRLFTMMSASQDIVRELVDDDEAQSRRLTITGPHERVLRAYLSHRSVLQCVQSEADGRNAILLEFEFERPLWELFADTFMTMMAEAALEAKTRKALLTAEEVSRDEVRARAVIVLDYMGCKQTVCLNCSRMFSQIYAKVEKDVEREKLQAERRAQKSRWLQQLQRQRQIADKQQTQRDAAAAHQRLRHASTTTSTQSEIMPTSHVNNHVVGGGGGAGGDDHEEYMAKLQATMNATTGTNITSPQILVEAATNMQFAMSYNPPPPAAPVAAAVVTQEELHSPPLGFAAIPTTAQEDGCGTSSSEEDDVIGLSMVPGSAIQRAVGNASKLKRKDARAPRGVASSSSRVGGASSSSAALEAVEDSDDDEVLLAGNTSDATLDKLSVEYIGRYRWTMMTPQEKAAAKKSHCFPPELININLGKTVADEKDRKRAVQKEVELKAERGRLQPHHLPVVTIRPATAITPVSTFCNDNDDNEHGGPLDIRSPNHSEGQALVSFPRGSTTTGSGSIISMGGSHDQLTATNSGGFGADLSIASIAQSKSSVGGVGVGNIAVIDPSSLLAVPKNTKRKSSSSRRRRGSKQSAASGSGSRRSSVSSVQSTAPSSDVDIPELLATSVPIPHPNDHTAINHTTTSENTALSFSDFGSDSGSTKNKDTAPVHGGEEGGGSSTADLRFDDESTLAISPAATTTSPTLSALEDDTMPDETNHPAEEEEEESDVELTPFGSDLLEESRRPDASQIRQNSRNSGGGADASSSFVFTEKSIGGDDKTAAMDDDGFGGSSFGGSSFGLGDSSSVKHPPAIPRERGNGTDSPHHTDMGSPVFNSEDPFGDVSPMSHLYSSQSPQRPGSASGGRPPLPNRVPRRRSISPGVASGGAGESPGVGALTPFSNDMFEVEEAEDSRASSNLSGLGMSKASSFGSLGGSRSQTPSGGAFSGGFSRPPLGTNPPLPSSMKRSHSTSGRRVSIILPPKPPPEPSPYHTHPIFKHALTSMNRRHSRTRKVFIVDTDRIQATDLRIRKYRIKKHFKQQQAEQDDELVPANLFRASVTTCRLSNLMDLYYTSIFIESAAAEMRVFTNVALKITAAWAEALRNRNIARLKFLQLVVDRVQNTISEKVASAATTEELVQNFLALNSDDPWEHLLWDEVIQRARTNDTCFEEREQMQRAYFDRERYNRARHDWLQFEKFGWAYEDEVGAFCDIVKVVEREEEQRIRILTEESQWRVVPICHHHHQDPLQSMHNHRVDMEGMAGLRNLLPANTVLLTPLPIERRLITTDEPPPKTKAPSSRIRGGITVPLGGNNITAPQKRFQEQIFLSMFVLDGVDRLAGGRLIILPPLTYDEEITADFYERDESNEMSLSQSQPGTEVGNDDNAIGGADKLDGSSITNIDGDNTTADTATGGGRSLSTLLTEFGKHSPTRFIHTLYAALGIMALEDLRRRTIEEYDSHLRDSLASFHRWSCNFKAPQLLVKDIEKERLLQSFTLLDQHERTGIFLADVEVRRVWLKPYAALLGECARGWVGISEGEECERERLLLNLGDPSSPTPCCESRCRYAITQEEEVQRLQMYAHGNGLVKTRDALIMTPFDEVSISPHPQDDDAYSTADSEARAHRTVAAQNNSHGTTTTTPHNTKTGSTSNVALELQLGIMTCLYAPPPGVHCSLPLEQVLLLLQ